ncbi:alpha/beta fold hydrolase [Micromonospora sp. NPDC006431]|uniref:alpha/beta fold hydrolase n=1 Tax=Micromonospora sp. NPDC006431 TaxID=3364235 RepID=UPI0036C1D3EC
MISIYRSAAGREQVRQWCADQIAGSALSAERLAISTSVGDTHVLSCAPQQRPAVMVLPGTNFNAATCLPLAQALAARWPTWVLDVPGQPGLSAGERPRRTGLAWYGRWLAEVLDQADTAGVVLVGHSLGGGIALACHSSKITGRVLIAPAGLARLKVNTAVLAATVPWLAHPTEQRSARLLRLMHGPGHQPTRLMTEWMTLVAGACRTSLAPSPLPPAILRPARGAPLLVATGEYDTFLPPGRLGPAAARRLGLTLRTMPNGGHLAPDEQPDGVVRLVEEVMSGQGEPPTAAAV